MADGGGSHLHLWHFLSKSIIHSLFLSWAEALPSHIYTQCECNHAWPQQLTNHSTLWKAMWWNCCIGSTTPQKVAKTAHFDSLFLKECSITKPEIKKSMMVETKRVQTILIQHQRISQLTIKCYWECMKMCFKVAFPLSKALSFSLLQSTQLQMSASHQAGRCPASDWRPGQGGDNS